MLGLLASVAKGTSIRSARLIHKSRWGVVNVCMEGCLIIYTVYNNITNDQSTIRICILMKLIEN